MHCRSIRHPTVRVASPSQETRMRRQCPTAAGRMSGNTPPAGWVVGIREISRELQFFVELHAVEPRSPELHRDRKIKPIAMAREKVKTDDREQRLHQLFRILGMSEEVELLPRG